MSHFTDSVPLCKMHLFNFLVPKIVPKNMANCKHLKIKIDRTLECRLTGKKISWELCKNCKIREFKIPVNTNTLPNKKVAKKHLKKPHKDISSKTRKIVNERDNKACILCGKKSNHLHHIIYRSEDSTLIDEPNNICCLCFDCHELVHSNKDKYQSILMDKMATLYSVELYSMKKRPQKKDENQ